MKPKRYETEHESHLGTAKIGAAAALAVAVIYAMHRLLKGDSFGRAMAGAAVCSLVLLLADSYFLIDWALDAQKTKRILQNGTAHKAVLTSEHEIRRGGKNGIRIVWKYSVKLEDNTVLTSTAYIEQIRERNCTAYVLGSDCVLTDFRSLEPEERADHYEDYS